MPTTPKQIAVSATDLEQEARQVEAEAQRAMSELAQPATPQTATQTPPSGGLGITGDSPNNSVLASQYETEINRLKAHSQEMELKVQQAEAALQQFQQQLSSQQPNHPSVGAQQELVDKLRQQQAQSDAYRQELEQKLSTGGSQDHLHAEYAPLPQVTPVISEQPTPTPAPAPAAAPTEPVAPAAPTVSPTTPPASVVPQDAGGELDLQAKMAAAGVGGTEPAVSAPTTSASTATDAAAPQQKTVALTNQPNIINGSVVDAQGQLIPGVVVVVKNAQGESKRALKTNKLGQFVVTTPLSNGTYSVEVDKKGLSFDIMKVELTGSVLQPILIKSKSG